MEFDRHPSQSELDAFLAAKLPLDETVEVLKHLIVRCAHCLSRLEKKAAVLFHPELPAAEGSGWQYNAVLCARERWVRRQERGRLSDNKFTPEFWLASYHKLLEESHRLRYTDPPEMVEKARRAWFQIRFLRTDDFPPGTLADLSARGQAAIANACRVNEDFVNADFHFKMAMADWQLGTQDKGLLAFILDLWSSYHRARRDFDQAFEYLDNAFLLYLSVGDLHLAGKTLIKNGISKSYSATPEEALDLLQRGLAMIEPDRDFELHVATVHNLLCLFADRGEYLAGRQLIQARQKIYCRQADPLNRLKLRWLEGRIAAGLGEWEEAEKAFREVRTAFLRRKMAFLAALVSIDLATLWLEQGRHRQIADLAAKMIAVFERLHLERETLAVWLLVEKAARQEQVTQVLLRRTAERLTELLQPRKGKGAEL